MIRQNLGLSQLAIHSLEIDPDGNLQRDGEVIDTRNPKRGLQEFLDWLNDRKREAIEVPGTVKVSILNLQI